MLPKTLNSAEQSARFTQKSKESRQAVPLDQYLIIRLARLRKERNLTQQALAAKIGVHVVQLRRYESGTSQPTLDVIRRIAMTLGVSADLLLFGKDERGPDDDLRLQFEAVSRFDPEEKKIIRSLLDGMILKHEARRWSAEKSG